MIRELQTARLLLRPLQLSDAEQTQRIFPEWEIVKYLNAKLPWPFPADGVLTFYRDVSLPAIARGVEWHWTMRLREAPEQVIGAISLHRGDRDNRGFWIGLPWKDHGLTTEAVVATNDFWFGELGFKVLLVAKAVGNIASRRISEKTGMRIVGTEERDYVSGRLTSEIWEMTGGDWRQKRERLAAGKGRDVS